MEALLKNDNLLSKEDIRFDFEPFLEENEENLPAGLDSEYMRYIPYLENPFRNLFKLPKALSVLPMNAVLHQSWNTILILFTIILFISSPIIYLLLNTAIVLEKGAVAIALIIFILMGVLGSFVYMKIIYGTLNSLVESRKAPWLVEKIKRPYQDAYHIGWDKRLLTISFILPIVMELPLAWISLVSVASEFNLIITILSILAILIGHIGISIMIFVSLISVKYIIVNTRIYDIVLEPIIERVKGYTEGQESILTKKNYQVVGVLSDTPGLSIRSLGNIPVYGLGSGIFIINGLIFLLFSPLLLFGPIADALQSVASENNPFGLNFIIIAGVVLSSLGSFGAVLRPLIRITRVMGNFKNKALTELDPFLFDEITGIALRRDTEVTDETQILFMLRTYIYGMKVSPVNPFRLIQIVLLAVIYSARGLPFIIGIFA